MARFNTVSQGTKTTNLANAPAFSQTPELELVSILLTSFAQDQYYRSANDTFDKLKGLIAQCVPEFICKAAVYARTEFGMRSISHVVASEVAKYLAGKPYAKDFYHAVVHRPDDMMEILSYHTANNGKIPNSMKKGFAKAFDKFDAYQIGKYRGDGKSFKLIDIINLVHPVPTDKNREAITALVNGTLKNTGTWESELSKAGQQEDADNAKGEAWKGLIESGKIGYFALLRNLSNILKQAPDAIPAACKMLTEEWRIKKSLVLPFRFLTAIKQIQQTSYDGTRDVLIALSQAVELSLNNVPRYEGKTLIALDISGSMGSGGVSGATPAEIGAIFSVALYKTNNADMVVFATDAQYVSMNPMDSLLTLVNGIPFTGGGTAFSPIFQRANKAYDRIIILSDMQAWKDHWMGDNPTHAFAEYKKVYNTNPHVYSFDLAGHGSLQFPENNVYALAGFSDKVFQIMGLLEQDKLALINKIKSVSLT